ncbi:hypothetical protein [Dactylosporangium sp. CA-092794]|uniref:hypothetical protein n=1 Tax=Dactylosporangium sp. CA-092794 TaxID=3239929 RepID=UPI003D8BB8D1
MDRPSIPKSPDELTDTFRAIWSARGAAISWTFDVPPCPYDPGHLADLTASQRWVSYLPPELATPANRRLLAAIFPSMRSYAAHPDNAFTNDGDRSGWFDYDAAIDAPYRGTEEPQLVERLAKEQRTLLSLNEYIVASQDSKVFTGRYLDERSTWARIGSRLDGRLVAARFDGSEIAEGLGNEEPVDGSLLVAYDLEPADHGSVLGARSSGRPAAPRRSAADAGASMPIRPGAAAPAKARTKPDPAAAWRSITATYLRLGFHNELGISAEAYVASLPRFTRQPPGYRDRLGVPLLIEPRLPWQRQAQLAGIALSNGSRTSTYRPFDHRSELPDRPYAAWFNDWAQRFAEPIAPGDARRQLAEDEIGANVHELVAMELAHPELSLAGRFFEAIGAVTHRMPDVSVASGTGRDRFPCIFHWRGRAEVGANLNPVAFSIFCPLIRGALITTA